MANISLLSVYIIHSVDIYLLSIQLPLYLLMSSLLFDSSFKFKNWMNVNNGSLFTSKDSSLISPITCSSNYFYLNVFYVNNLFGIIK